jgi:hypothetical protein
MAISLELKERWKCCTCGYTEHEHEDEFEAKMCCDPLVREGFVCGVCGEWFDDQAKGGRHINEHRQAKVIEGKTPDQAYLDDLRVGSGPFYGLPSRAP